MSVPEKPLPPSMNPYAAPAEMGVGPLAGKVVTAELTPLRPQPGLGMAIVWTLLLAVMQIVFSIVVAIAASVYWLVQGKSADELAGLLESELNVVLLPGATLVTLLSAWGLARLMLGRDYLRLVGWRGFAPLHLVWVLLLVLPLGILGGEVAAWADEVLPSFLGETMDGMSELPLAVIFLGGCLFPALGEELFFRGFLSRGLLGRHGLLAGSVAASLLFAIIHIDPVQACGTFVLGLGFQYIFLTTRSLALPIVAHLLNNMLAFAMVLLDDEPLVAATVSTEVEHVPLLVTVASLAVLVPLLGLLYQTRTRWVLPGGERWHPPFLSCEGPPPELAARTLVAWPRPLLVVALAVAYAGLIAAVATSDL